jgi:hypothetical protein
MSLSVSNLEKKQGSKKISKVVKQIINILLAAINDWPNPIVNLADYEKEIFNLVGKEIDKQKLEEYISNIDYSKNAWKAESLSQLIEVYNFYEDSKPLDEILSEIKERIEEL